MLQTWDVCLRGCSKTGPRCVVTRLKCKDVDWSKENRYLCLPLKVCVLESSKLCIYLFFYYSCTYLYLLSWALVGTPFSHLYTYCSCFVYLIPFTYIYSLSFSTNKIHKVKYSAGLGKKRKKQMAYSRPPHNRIKHIKYICHKYMHF